MSSAPAEAPVARPENEWTIMVFFAGDPHLSPSMTAQLKAIKDAGFQENTSVLVHYDPNERGVATTTFDINSYRKKEKGTIIGDGKDPYVRNLVEDAIDGAHKINTADQSLRSFLEIGASEKYKAKHYMLFLVGHGVIVGNDMFLPDADPQSGISLEQLGDTLRHFRGSIPKDAEFELLGLHSCSMSGIEVAFELKNTARYMMATEGASFVASWPYRQLLKRILNAIDNTKPNKLKREIDSECLINNNTEVDVDCLIKSIHGLSYHNSTDFMFSGLSADLCLCSLNEDLVDALKDPVEKLARALKEAMKPTPDWDPEKEWRGVELIKLAHLEAQSYFQETYTDLYDFCLCLSRRCDKDQQFEDLKTACDEVITALAVGEKNVIVQSNHFGPLFQYSHGLSVFFPWQRPIEQEPVALDENMMSRYEKYEFTKAFGKDSWLSFLKEYFTATQRKSREEEDGEIVITAVSGNGASSRIFGTTATGIVDSLAAAKDSPSLTKDSPSLKDSPRLSEGCTCSIKNYPMKFSSIPIAKENPNRAADQRAERARQARLAEGERLVT